MSDCHHATSLTTYHLLPYRYERDAVDEIIDETDGEELERGCAIMTQFWSNSAQFSDAASVLSGGPI